MPCGLWVLHLKLEPKKFTDEFKRDAVAQVEDRGHPVREVAERLERVALNPIHTLQL